MKQILRQSRSLRRFEQVLSQLGFSLVRASQIRHLIRYFRDKRKWEKLEGTRPAFFPILGEHKSDAGTAKGHYFFQDLIVAQEIFKENPKRHIDVGSRVDGFVAHVAAFRPISVIDLRPLSPEVKNINFIQSDITQPQTERADSVSCLHAIEHIGLGRYGDEIDPEGHRKAFRNLVDMVAPGGSLYVSFPVSNQARVEFNAHRVFGPLDIFSWPTCDELKLEKYFLVGDDGLLVNAASPSKTPHLSFGCGIYKFRKSDSRRTSKVIA